MTLQEDINALMGRHPELKEVLWGEIHGGHTLTTERPRPVPINPETVIIIVVSE